MKKLSFGMRIAVIAGSFPVLRSVVTALVVDRLGSHPSLIVAGVVAMLAHWMVCLRWDIRRHVSELKNRKTVQAAKRGIAAAEREIATAKREVRTNLDLARSMPATARRGLN